MTHASPRRLNYFRDGCGCFCGYCGMPPLLFQVGAAHTRDLFGKRSIKNFQEVEAPTKASPFGRGGGAADGEGVTKGNRLLQKSTTRKRLRQRYRNIKNAPCVSAVGKSER